MGSLSNSEKLHWALLTGAFLILIFFSCYKLAESPPLWFDEGFYTQIGMNIASHGMQSIQVAPQSFISTSFITVGYPLLYPLGLSYTLFGVGVLQGRLVMVLFIVGLGILTYTLIRRIHNKHVGVLSVFLLATFPMLYGNGKTVIGEVPGLFFLVASLWALARLEGTGYQNLRWYGIAGALVALCAVTKPIYILFPLALLLTYLLRIQHIKLSLTGTLFGLFSFLVPTALWIFLQFGSDASLSAILATYANPSGVHTVQTFVLENVQRFFTESTPMYTALILLLWSISLVIRWKRETLSSVEIAAFLFCSLIIISYLRIEGWYRYLFPATLLVLVFLPYACVTIYIFIRKRIALLPVSLWIPYACIALLGCGQLYQTIDASFVAGYYTSTRTREISQALQGVDPRTKFFLYNTPALAILLPTQNYYQYAAPSATLTIGEEELPVLQNGQADMVIVMESDLQANPGLFTRYTVSKQIAGYNFLIKK